MKLSTDSLTPEEKRARLQQLLNERGSTVDQPLSYGQEALWHLHRLSPESAAYNTLWTTTLRGPLDVERLRRAFAKVLERHWILRSTYHVHDGEPRHSAGTAPELQVIDATSWGAAKVERWVTETAELPFDLERGPIVRLTALRLASDRHLLHCAAHHIAVDYWSLVVLADELRQIYQDASDARLASAPTQFVEMARRQRARVSGAEGERLWQRWHARLSGDLPVLELSTDRPRPTVRSGRGGLHHFSLEPRLLDGLRELARARGKTLYALCLAAFDVLLHRYTGQTDLLVGSPMAGRDSLGAESMIGFFANTIVLRARCDGNPRFVDFLDHVSDTVLEALGDQALPFPVLVERLKVAPSRSRAPLCDVLFSWDKPHYRDDAPHGPATDTLEWEHGAARQMGSTHDLALVVFERANGLTGAVHYSADLFEASTIARLADHYVNLLTAIVGDPTQPIGQLNLLSAAERHQLLVEWNATQTDYPRDLAVDEIFEAQAAATPAAVAIVHGTAQITYEALNRDANRVAHYLLRRGLTRGAMVGVCLRRSPSLVTILLGILKAGAVYVPLDPASPKTRLAAMLDGFTMPLVLTEQNFAGLLPATAADHVIVDDPAPWAAESDDTPAVASSPTDLAYVMFTSGSTGNPKGVAVPHRGIVRLVKNSNYLTVGPDDVFLLAAPVSFDASTFEMWGSLLNGARLAVLDAEGRSIDDIGGAIARYGVTTMFLTTGLFNLLVEQRLSQLQSLTQLLFGGDLVSTPLVDKAWSELRSCRLTHCYGPTENTTFTTTYDVVERPEVGRTVSIGTPIANSQVYVLDEHRQPVPIGVVGELYAGGDGVALGYVNHAELTAERFIVHPFVDDPQARLYRTGDLVRFLPTGGIEFLSRRDQQVKVRGFRVELSEVETALQAHPAVGHCAVILGVSEIGDKRLVGFVVPADATIPAAADLRRHLLESLPDYMVPSLFVVRDALPLSPTGKIDRRALATVPLSAPSGPSSSSAPLSPTEQRMAEVWSALLGVEQIGANDDFFLLGGHSLLGTRLLARVSDEFGVDLPLRLLFQQPTIAALAEAVDAHSRERAAADRDDILGELDQMSEEEIEAELARGRGDLETRS